MWRGGVERLTHCHTEGQWPGTEDRAGLASQPWLCHLLELQPRNTHQGACRYLRPGPHSALWKDLRF